MILENILDFPPITTLLVCLSLILFFLLSGKKSKNQKQQFISVDHIPISYKKIADAKEESKTVTVLSYNIMAYNFTKLEWFPYVKNEYLYPKYRCPKIVDEISQINADIVCLQECDSDLFNDFYKNFIEKELGYTTIIKPLTGSFKTKRNVVNIICYKPNYFELVNSRIVDLNEDLINIDESFSKHKEALIAEFVQKSSKKKFIVISTQLYWNPDYEYIRFGEIAQILSKVYQLYGKSTLILCGDLKSGPQSNVLKFIYNDIPRVDERNVSADFPKNKKFVDLISKDEKYKNKYNLRSAYDCYKEGTNYAECHPSFTTYTNEIKSNIDYIIYTSDSLKLLNLLDIPCNNEIVRRDKMPNQIFPSDHFKLSAKFEFC